MAAEVDRFAVHADELQVALRLPNGDVHHHTFLPLPEGAPDVEVSLTLGTTPVVVRRVRCGIADGLLHLGEPAWVLSAAVRAGLLWRAYRRYSELVGLKKLAGGLSGSDVLVFRPKLRPPPPNDDPDLSTAGPAELLDEAWGSPLLVKCGPVDEVRKEWARAERFLRDRQSPFIARQEELLVVRPAGAEECPPRAVLFSSFLGGDVVWVEPLDKVIRGTTDTARCQRLLDGVFAHLATWHTNPQPRPLLQWSRCFQFADGPPSDRHTADNPDPWLLFGRFNFRKEHAGLVAKWDRPRRPDEPSSGRDEYRSGLMWDTALIETEHLNGHLLGKGESSDGLLWRLAEIPALFSLTHGDLNPRNVLCDADHTWLIDFEHTGVGPVLADFARLEINLRLWCIELGAATTNTAQTGEDMERLLLAHFHGSESSLEPVRRFARGLGADPDELEKVARCVVHVRRLARRWCVPQFVDGRDYLAVLYLQLLRLLEAASKAPVSAAGVRWAVGLLWVLEEALDRVLGRTPYDREQRPYDPLRHVSAEWLRAGGAAGRVHYLCDTADGREVLGPVAALRGVLQGGYHHLDVYHHTLAVLTYLEALLTDPIRGLMDPAGLDAQVARALAGFGLLTVQPTPEQQATAVTADWFTDDMRAAVAKLLADALTDDARLLLKWCGLLHDVGKPGTRTTSVKRDEIVTQFLGHPEFGLTVVREHLREWFPDKPVRERLEELILNHHRGHQLLAETKPLALLPGLLRGEPHPAAADWLGELSREQSKAYRPDLPLLLLHAYADRLASRGTRFGQPVAAFAEAALAILAGLVTVPKLQAADAVVAARQEVVEAAALAYATELKEVGWLTQKQFGTAMGALKAACEGQAGTVDELLAHFRTTLPANELLWRLGGPK